MTPNRNLVNIFAAAATFVTSMLCAASDGMTEEVRVLSANLAVNFKCENEPRSVLETDVEAFLKDEGFAVLNLGRIQRDQGLNLQYTKIIGRDDSRRIIELAGFFVPVLGKVLYTISLMSPPPTHRSSELEKAILALVTEKLGCAATQVARGENGADAAAFYNREVARIDNLFREVVALQKPNE
jgi:hypothetical protein